MVFQLDQVVPYGRSYAEYRRMFALTDKEMKGRILGVADGPSSFNAEATRAGYKVVSVDPLYDFSAQQIQHRIKQTFERVVQETRANAHQFVWKEFQNVEAVASARKKAMKTFIEDYPNGRHYGRYIPASLPMLPFEDGQFDIAVCSHFLFLYSEQLDYRFHLAAMQEMLRVARQVRVFPLHTLANQPSPHVQPLIRALIELGFEVGTRHVDYEFQRGAHRMFVAGRAKWALNK